MQSRLQPQRVFGYDEVTTKARGRREAMRHSTRANSCRTLFNEIIMSVARRVCSRLYPAQWLTSATLGAREVWIKTRKTPWCLWKQVHWSGWTLSMPTSISREFAFARRDYPSRSTAERPTGACRRRLPSVAAASRCRRCTRTTTRVIGVHVQSEHINIRIDQSCAWPALITLQSSCAE